MNQHRRRLLQGVACALPAVAAPFSATRAQTAASGGFPSRPLRIVVPFSPGSGSDVYARYFGKILGERVGQPLIVENRPGGGGAIAVANIMSSDADGYSILLGSNSPMAVNVSAYKSLPYDPLTDVTPLCGLTRSMAVMVVSESSPLRTLDDLVKRGKQGAQLNMGTYSAGYQLAAAPFLEQAGFTWQNVPYKGLSQTTSDVMGNQIDVAVIDTPGTTQIVKSGKIRALAVTGNQRHPGMPDVPTLVELGYKDAVHYSWTSLWVKSGTPQTVIDTLSGHLLSILGDSASREFVATNSGEIMPFGPAEMRKFQLAEIDRFAKAVRSLNFPLL